MYKIKRLKKEARDTARHRGHTLTKWLHWGVGRGVYATAGCKDCPGHVVVAPFPQPNSIEIGGTLMALNCPIETVKEHWP